MAKAQGVSRIGVQGIGWRYNLKFYLIKTFKFSRDPHFAKKLDDFVGRYLNLPDEFLVLCVDEKSPIQDLDRTKPGLLFKKSRCGKMTHAYTPHRTTTLIAAFNMLDGKVIGDCMPCHRHQEFMRFLKKINVNTSSDLHQHLIVDNNGTHKQPRVKSWLGPPPRFHLHFIPTSSSWLNLVEQWFRHLTDKCLHRGSFGNVRELISAVKDSLDNHIRIRTSLYGPHFDLCRQMQRSVGDTALEYLAGRLKKKVFILFSSEGV